MKNSLISRTCIMKPKDFLRSVILIVALAAFGMSSGVASDKSEAKHSGKITKARAERIALTKVPGGSIRSAELETARGQRFWAVYIAKPGRKTPKKFASTPRAVKFLLCKRKDQEIRPKSLRKTIKRLASGEGFNLWITTSHSIIYDINCMML